MSEENPCTTAVLITNPVKTHVKDPKKVEAGRKLAKISQEAKARKRAQRKAMKEEQNVLDVENKCEGSTITPERVGMVVGITVGLRSLYIMWCNRREIKRAMEESKSAEKPQPANHGPDLFD
jgi:lantibiotic modifying enzyme